MAGHLQSLVRKGKINKVQALKSLDFLMLTEDYTALRDADLILEVKIL
jgi:3-hydroxyacyl-CoA dehydrogenase